MAEEQVVSVDATEGLNLENPRIKELADFNELSAAPDAVKPVDEPKAGAEEQSATLPDADGVTEKKPPKYSNREIKRIEYANKVLTKRLEALEAGIMEQRKDVAKPMPKREQFATEQDYISELVDRRSAERDLKRAEQEREELAKSQETESLRSSWEEKIARNFSSDAEKQEYASALEELGHPNEVLNPQINSYIFKSPVGPKMLKYLSERPSVIPTLRDMHEWDLADALKKIAAFVGKPTKQEGKPSTPRTSSAPAPMGKLGQGSGTKSIDEMSDAELIAAQRAGTLKYT